MSEMQKVEKNKIAHLCEEIENLTRDADEILGEVVKCRKVYPNVIAEMKISENREKFARLIEAPLKSNRVHDIIDVEKLQKDITRRVNEADNISEKRKNLEMKMEKLRRDYQMWEQRCKRLQEIVNSEKYAPIHALPDNFTL